MGRKCTDRIRQKLMAMENLTEPKANQATLGSTTANTKLLTLSAEIHINIMAQLHWDPVSQLCLGLTSRHWHDIFHEVRDERDYGSEVVEAKKYPIKSKPFDLRMTVSVCGKYSVYGWHEDWYLFRGYPAIPDPEIAWEKSLARLLEEEKSLWGDLICCKACWKYKPGAAYETFLYEQRILKKYRRDFQEWGKKGINQYWTQCRRCRTKDIMVFLEDRGQVLESGHQLEERKSLGLMRKDGDPLKFTHPEARKIASNAREYHELVHRWETWEEVFEKLGI